MPFINPAVTQWIRQMAEGDQVIAYNAYQCLQEEVLHAAPAEQAALAAALGEALTATVRPGQGAGSRGAASFRNNPVLTSVSKETAEPLHPARVRCGLARLLGYLPSEPAVPFLAAALKDLEAREAARQALESHPSESATSALIAALDSAGPTFCAGVIHSLAKRRGDAAAAALRKAAEDRQPEVRVAALLALADFPEPAHDAILEKAAKAASNQERDVAHVARARLARSLVAAGNKPAAERISRAILASDAREPQKKAARLALGLA